MSRAVIVPFFANSVKKPGYNLMIWDFFKLQMDKWIKFVDKVYVIDSGVGIGNQNDPKIHVIHKHADSHWANMNEAVALASEDIICLLDSDMVVYKPEIIDEGFRIIEEDGYDVVSILDGSGGVDMNQYPAMRKNKYRTERRRFCPYLCFLKKSVLRPGFDFTPRGGEDWTDSMGPVTEQILADGHKIYELQDDRSTIVINGDGSTSSYQWLDGGEWARYERPDLGYYHIRNYGGAVSLIGLNDREADELLQVIPSTEFYRLQAWACTVFEKAGHRMPEIDILGDYYKAFRKYHDFIDKI